MRKSYCDKCKKEIFSKEYYYYVIRTIFYDQEGNNQERIKEYCKKCYKKVKKETLKKLRRDIYDEICNK